MSDLEKALERWQAHQEAELEHIKAEIFKANSYLQCLYQLRDAAILSSFPGGFRPSMEVKNAVVGAWKESEWQGLTDEEFEDCVMKAEGLRNNPMFWVTLKNLIEQALKEKNT